MTCPTCNGAGSTLEEVTHGVSYYLICFDCNGKGEGEQHEL